MPSFYVSSPLSFAFFLCKISPQNLRFKCLLSLTFCFFFKLVTFEILWIVIPQKDFVYCFNERYVGICGWYPKGSDLRYHLSQVGYSSVKYMDHFWIDIVYYSLLWCQENKHLKRLQKNIFCGAMICKN